MNLLISLIFLLSSLTLFAQERRELDILKNYGGPVIIDDPWIGFIYRQNNLELVDPQGDLFLLHTARAIPKKIWNDLKGNTHEFMANRLQKVKKALQDYPEFRPPVDELNIVINDYKVNREGDVPIELEGHKAPFLVKNLSLMFMQVIYEVYKRDNIKPYFGNPHQWDPRIKPYLKERFPFFANMSKLLVALSRGATSNYMVTGYEEELIKVILGHPEKSITLDKMFEFSYVIAKGDVYLSLLTIENVLNRYWTDSKRARRAVTTKLKDITNYNYHTDKFGSWYHLFGIILFGYVEGGAKATIIGNIETAGSQVLSRFQDERQETYINSRGGRVGARLRRFVKKQSLLKFSPNENYRDESFYLRLDEDFSRRIQRKTR